MRIAVASEGLEVSPHAGHCTSFMCYSIERGVITECQNLPNLGFEGLETVKLLKDLGIDALLTGGIDMDLANALCHAGIEVVAGVKGTAREVALDYLNHTLIGATELCHTLFEEAENSEEPDLDDTFNRIEHKLELGVRA